jgi:hypothetical protein
MMLFVSIYGCDSDIADPIMEWYVKFTILEQKIESDSAGNIILTDTMRFSIKEEYKDMTEKEIDVYVDEAYQKYSYRDEITDEGFFLAEK